MTGSASFEAQKRAQSKAGEDDEGPRVRLPIRQFRPCSDCVEQDGRTVCTMNCSGTPAERKVYW